MAKSLFNKLLNKEVSVETLINWLILKEENDKENGLNLECGKADFVTFFLNFIHEEISSFCRDGEAHQQFTPKKLEKQSEVQKPLIKRRGTLFSANKSGASDKCNSFSFENNSLINESAESANLSFSSVSTPKNAKSNRNSPVHGLLSPISPLYKGNNSFSSPKNRKFENKCSPICLGDFLVNNSNSSNKKSSKKAQKCSEERASRRINPTNLGQKIKDTKNSFRTENSFNFQASQSSASELSVENVEEQRSLLAEERVKILSNRLSIDSFNKISLSNISSNSKKEEIVPNPNLVTFESQLNIAVEIYVAILTNNFYLNLTSEIYFLISMLTCRQFENSLKNGFNSLELDDTSSEIKLFHSIHNVVYFAVKSINNLINFLKHIDKSTLKLLSDNKRIKDFFPELSDKFSSISDSKTERIIEIIPQYNEHINVCFNLDTDNRNHFPNDGSFHAFRKQRDLFYEILRIWEVNHLLSGWNFTYGLAGKIRSLFSLNSEPANFMHLARLFKAQLLSTCSKSSKEDGLTENQLPILSFGNIDKDKLDRLKSRLVTKQTSNGISSLPIFPGHQEFYREFIVVASNPIFNRHLCDSLIGELLELNETKFECSDVEENEVDQNTRQSYLSCIRNLRLLAKFLGFTESLPYFSNVEYSETLLESQIHLREKLQPSFDVKLILERAVLNKTLILTIPWLVKYFAMLDYVTLRLPYYKSVINLLFRIHNSINEENCVFYNFIMIKLSLGWLFELSHFPDNNYFNYCFQSHERSLDLEDLSNLDKLPLIDQNLLYVLCPYLDEIKKLLNNNSTSNIRVKHITPVTALESPKEITKKKIQHQLEEAFFNGQPISVRKTVEFVSERVASSCVKHICSNLVPDFKKEAIKEFTEIANEWKLNYDKMSTEIEQKNFKISFKQKYNVLATEKLKLLLDIINKSVIEIIDDKVPISINGLTPINNLKQVNDACISITRKTCLDRIQQWINTHVTVAIFVKDFDTEITKILNNPLKETGAEMKPVFLLPTIGNKDKIHNENSLSAAHLLEKVKNITIDVMQMDVPISDEIIINILDEAKITLSERIDVNECISSHTCMLFVDLSILLLTHTQILSSIDIKLKFLDLWRCYYGNPEYLFKTLVCPRNIMILAQSADVRKAWDSLAEWAAFLIKHGFLSSECFESQCAGIFRKDWDAGTLKCLTEFLKAFIKYHRSNGGEYDKFTFLLEFLSDYCSDLF